MQLLPVFYALPLFAETPERKRRRVNFVYEPKRLMRFNMSVNKDLGGAICMIKGLAFRQLRTLGSMIPPEHASVF